MSVTKVARVGVNVISVRVKRRVWGKVTNASVSGEGVGVEFEMQVYNTRGDFFVNMFEVF